MNWDARLLARVDAGSQLSRWIDRMFAQQRANWKALADGEKALGQVTVKEFADGDDRVVVQANPGRSRSTYARVDPDSVARRPCFLCPENMPAEERGVAFRNLVVLPNPHPVAPRHCTIPSREHLPQRLAEGIPDLLSLTRALGPDMLVFYNGPRCGASAPDHFHFQACDTRAVPLFSHLPENGRIRAATSLQRRMLVLNDNDPEDAERSLTRVLEAWSQMSPEPDEPAINVLALYRKGRYQIVVFPRAKHRPSCFYSSGNARIAVSPAALEMGGILVVAEPAHFDKVDRQRLLAIYREVSIDQKRLADLARAVA